MCCKANIIAMYKNICCIGQAERDITNDMIGENQNTETLRLTHRVPGG